MRDGRITVRALFDLPAGTELSISYLSFEESVASTVIRRGSLLDHKYVVLQSTIADFQYHARPQLFVSVLYPRNCKLAL